MDPFIHTLTLLQDSINKNLPIGVRKVWVDGNARSKTLSLTIFPDIGVYKIVSHTIKNFRNVQSEMDESTVDKIIQEYSNTLQKIIIE